VILSNKV